MVERRETALVRMLVHNYRNDADKESSFTSLRPWNQAAIPMWVLGGAVRLSREISLNLGDFGLIIAISLRIPVGT